MLNWLLKTNIVFILLIVIIINKCNAWNNTGHELVAAIAEKQLTITSQIKINKLLNYPISNIADQQLLSRTNNIITASVWADAIKAKKYNYSNKEYYKQLHFINIPVDLSLSQKENLSNFDNNFKQIIASKNTNIYYGINSSIIILKNPKATEEQKAIALRLLIHLVGDLHEPLHVADFIVNNTSTRGGNNIKISNVIKIPVEKTSYAKFDHINDNYYITPKNLHQLWDEMGGSVIQIKSPVFTKSYKKQMKQINKEADQIIGKYKNIKFNYYNLNLEQWIKDNYKQALISAYNNDFKIVASNDNKLSVNINDNSLQFIKDASKKNIYLAGVRLAKLLNSIFDKSL
ncbi:S1/P1 nuclease [Rickettsiales bacterium LUAb2]